MRGLSCLLAMLNILAVPSAHAQETFTKPLGGSGGRPFALRCPAGTALTGLSTRQGAYINYIAPICDGQTQAGAGGGGNLKDASCPYPMRITSLLVVSLRSPNHLLKSVVLRCMDKKGNIAEVLLRSPGAYTTAFKFYNDPTYPYADAVCLKGRILGLQGRSGDAVDALGLICSK